MGAIEGLLEAQYDVLRENGHSPSEAFNETVEELTQSLGPLFGAKGMDWMYANCSTTAQRGALDWAPRFREAIKPVMEWLYYSVKTGNEAQISIDKNSQADYREKLNAELEDRRILLNKEIIAIDQDPLGKAAERLVNTDTHQIFVRPLANGSHAVAILNTADKALPLTVDFAQLGLKGKYGVRDVWQHKDIARNAKRWKGTVASHETKVFILK